MPCKTGFIEFWNLYPRKVGRLAAEREYARALKRATPDAILAGLMLFNRNLPQEPRFICHARTWLHQGRWLDELPGVKQRQAEDWYENCRLLHNNECGLSRWRHADRLAIDAMKAERSRGTR